MKVTPKCRQLTDIKETCTSLGIWLKNTLHWQGHKKTSCTQRHHLILYIRSDCSTSGLTGTLYSTTARYCIQHTIWYSIRGGQERNSTPCDTQYQYWQEYSITDNEIHIPWQENSIPSHTSGRIDMSYTVEYCNTKMQHTVRATTVCDQYLPVWYLTLEGLGQEKVHVKPQHAS